MVWVLLGKRRGDNNQAIALAEALGVPFVEKQLRFTLWRYLPRAFSALGLWTVDAETRRGLAPPWPALAIGVGKRSVPAARAIRAASGGATRIVMLGDPHSPARWFDLVLTTPQYRMAAAPNVHVLPIALSRGIARHAIGADAIEPAHVLLVGGPSWPWRPVAAAVIEIALRCRAQAEAAGGTVLALTGARTARRLKEALGEVLGAESVDRVDYQVALSLGTIFHVTADSAAMLSDAIATGRPVAMLPVEAGRVGRWWAAAWRRLRPDAPLWPRDLPRFWASVQSQGLVGTVNRPSAGAAPDVSALARKHVEPLLEMRPPEGDAT